ncbi:hypothetical protein [Butyrivibrio sp. AE3006]|uniref:hypothetical protein n=1 Tax=Butyrivibrio sp. AE3006 TaxID=1280673 RepID=UPI00041C57F2|nr:hypothetical protein [Butyrivibrio sp. AE3006]
MSSKDFILMRKDEGIAVCKLNENGHMIKFSIKDDAIELLPLEDRNNRQEWLKLWWKDRAVPIKQGRIAKFLSAKGIMLPEEYLMNNLGLSLTDYYWIRPMDVDLKWKDVNLFDNKFTENVLIWPDEDEDEENREAQYSPNSSLQGQLEKTWTIIDGERYLIKGNHSNLSTESINEVVATAINEEQDHTNHVKYSLVHINGKEYDYGCSSRLMTSQNKELVSAYALISSRKKSNDISNFQHLLNVCEDYGMNIGEVREDLDYQILLDFVMSGYDRHLNNIAFLRNADTLRIERVAPVYDCGGAMYAGMRIPQDNKELIGLKTNGFAANEQKMLKLVNNPWALDTGKLPSTTFIKEMYSKDSQMNDRDIDRLASIYAKKIDMLEKWRKSV